MLLRCDHDRIAHVRAGLPDPQFHGHCGADVGSGQVEHAAVEALDNVRYFFQRQVGCTAAYKFKDGLVNQGVFFAGGNVERIQKGHTRTILVAGITAV